MEQLLQAQIINHFDIASFVVGLLLGAAITAIAFTYSSWNTDIIQDNLLRNVEAIDKIDAWIGDSDDDTRSGHFTLEVLLSYIKYIKDGASKISTPVSGIEFFFARYPTSDTGTNNVPPQPGRSTIILYPTYWDAALQHHTPFDPFLNKKANGEPVSLIDVKANRGDIRYDHSRVALNKSHMSPPRRNTI